jgi:DNA invertase Pin-like site-specific DNA recombinase
MISQRTKAALAQKKAEGVVLGNPRLDEFRGNGAEGNRAAAEVFAATVLPIINGVRKAGATSLREIAKALNDRGVATARGGSWHASNVANVLARA